MDSLDLVGFQTSYLDDNLERARVFDIFLDETDRWTSSYVRDNFDYIATVVEALTTLDRVKRLLCFLITDQETVHLHLLSHAKFTRIKNLIFRIDMIKELVYESESDKYLLRDFQTYQTEIMVILTRICHRIDNFIITLDSASDRESQPILERLRILFGDEALQSKRTYVARLQLLCKELMNFSLGLDNIIRDLLIKKTPFAFDVRQTQYPESERRI